MSVNIGVMKVSMSAVEEELKAIYKDYNWIKRLYTDLCDCAHIQGSGTVWKPGLGFVPVISTDVIITRLMDRGWAIEELEADLINELITLYALVAKKEIPVSCFRVSTDFPFFYKTIVGELPDETGTSNPT